jgi:hypothetical protein
MAATGGAIEVEGGSLKLIHSAITRNRSTFEDGGGIAIEGGSATIKKTWISFNISSDEGGGVFVGAGTDVIVDSTLSNNRSYISGGGIANFAKLTMRNDTVANNVTQENGGGISTFSGSLVLNDLTIAGNEAATSYTPGYAGGGIYAGSGTVTISNSLIALNTLGGPGTDPNCSGSFISKGNNLRTTSDADCLGFTGTGDFVNPNPRIGRLAPKGSPNPVIPLHRNSPAIGKANPKTSEKRDERGQLRDPKHPDIGAYEAPG